MAGIVRHLYVHLPFCSHRCGYCDFVTVVGRDDAHAAYVEALLHELELERDLLATSLETVFVGGGTPTLTDPAALARLLAALPRAEELTVEANPETITPAVAHVLRDGGVTRVSLGAQSFTADLLRVLERQAGPDDVRRAVHTLRDANFANISLDLIYGIPGQRPADIDHDLAEALTLSPEHLSLYELEAKTGTRFTHAWGAELERQAEAMETYLEYAVDVLTRNGYRWYETANFCLQPDRAGGRDLRSQHNLAYWLGRDYVGLGIGAVSTVGEKRWRNLPSLARYVASLATPGRRPPREVEELDGTTRNWERVMLGLRLDEPLELTGAEEVVERVALARLDGLGLVDSGRGTAAGSVALRLTRRGRLLGDAVTAELLTER